MPRGRPAVGPLRYWAPSVAILRHREVKLALLLQTRKRLARRDFWARTRYTKDTHLAPCLTGCFPAHWVKHTQGFVSEEIQRPAVKQQAFPKPAFCNTAGTKRKGVFPESLFYQNPANSATASASSWSLHSHVQGEDWRIPGTGRVEPRRCSGLILNQPLLRHWATTATDTQQSCRH